MISKIKSLFRKDRYSKLAFIFILLYCLVYFKLNFLDNGRWRYLVSGDGRGYYAFLPATLIYQDAEFKFLYVVDKEQFKDNPEMIAPFVKEVNNRKVNKHFVGVAVLMLPFFLFACLASAIFQLPVDGYSFFFQTSVFLAAVFYLFLGLYYLRKLLLKYNLSDKVIGVTLVAFALGTNLQNYVLNEPSLSHVYSFSLVAVFCYASKCILEEYRRRTLILLSLLLGLIIICRPVNGMVVLAFPFFASDFKSFLSGLKNILADKIGLLAGLGAFCAIIFIQVLAYYIQTGQPYVYAYKEEHLDFLKPNIEIVLWSYRKGLFMYTPLIFISLFGFYYLARQSIYRFATLLVFLLFTIYIVSCWTNPIYGVSYGLRAFIEFFPFYAILFALLLHYSRKLVTAGLFFLTFCAILLNQVQAYQYSHSILDGQDMNKKRYWDLFLRTNDRYIGIVSKRYYETFPPENIVDSKAFFNDFDADVDWGSKSSYTSEQHFSGRNSALIRMPDKFSPGFEMNIAEFPDSLRTYIQVSFKSYITSSSCYPELVISFENSKEMFSYNTFPLKFAVDKTDEWRTTVCGTWVPIERRSPEDRMKVYFLNNTKKPFYADDVEVKVIVLKPGS